MEKPHKRLIAWQKSMDLVVLIYELTKTFPPEEVYGLVSQLRRAVISVPSNIAEGAADRTTQQFANFLSVSIGSSNEIDTQLEPALRIGYIKESEYEVARSAVDECLALTYGLRRKILAK